MQARDARTGHCPVLESSDTPLKRKHLYALTHTRDVHTGDNATMGNEKGDTPRLMRATAA